MTDTVGLTRPASYRPATRREQEPRDRTPKLIDSPSRDAAKPAAAVVGAREDGERLLLPLRVRGRLVVGTWNAESPS
jgi:hypothetical protein